MQNPENLNAKTTMSTPALSKWIKSVEAHTAAATRQKKK